jgi:hypothetical protein
VLPKSGNNHVNTSLHCSSQPHALCNLLQQACCIACTINEHLVLQNQVESLNGIRIKNMQQLVKEVDGCTSAWLSIVLENFETVSSLRAHLLLPTLLECAFRFCCTQIVIYVYKVAVTRKIFPTFFLRGKNFFHF